MSDELVDELLSADELVLVAPVYNFGIPAAMKAWIDQVVRAGRTFRFTEQGPVGLLKARRAWIVTASAGTAVGSEVDFNTTYLRTILGFIGVPEVRVIAAEKLQLHGEVGRRLGRSRRSTLPLLPSRQPESPSAIERGAEHSGQLSSLALAQHRDDLAFGIEMVDDHLVDDLQALRGQSHDDLAPILSGIALDEASLFEAVDAVRDRPRGDHRLADELACHELVRRARAAQRREDVVHPVLEAVTGEVLGQPPVDQTRQARHSPDHLDR